MQSPSPEGLRERFKRALLGRVDWWFAYTNMTRDYLVSQGVQVERVTVVNNSVDDRRLLTELGQYQHRSPADVARDLGCRDGAKLALYCGQLHRHKRIDFLLQAANRVRQLVPEFELMIVGDGPDRALVEAAARDCEWIHYAGSVLGAKRAKYWRAAQAVMMPGLVGLVIVDSFIARCPLVTTAHPYHSPEIAYLQSGENGLMTDDDLEAYARAVAALLQDDARRAALRNGCAASAVRYSLSAMVERFAGGIEQCLDVKARRTDFEAVAHDERN